MAVRPVLFYGAECCSKETRRNYIHVVEMSILRLACGVTTNDGPVRL